MITHTFWQMSCSVFNLVLNNIFINKYFCVCIKQWQWSQLDLKYRFYDLLFPYRIFSNFKVKVMKSFGKPLCDVGTQSLILRSSCVHKYGIKWFI